MDKPEALAAIDATGSIINTFVPGIGSIAALALGGLCGLALRRGRKHSARRLDALHQRLVHLPVSEGGGVFTTVAGLVDQLSDNPAARLVAEEIFDRVNRVRAEETTRAA